ncbi:MAG: UvrD-helicase domain-containing protein [Alphaproteobacteria bacterium]|nr:UvrD-helicase domain-containing protein [Alphaproteobacteria bacterium]
MPHQIAGKSQQLAAHPHHSVWVAASAGSGKTKVLTDRVLNLLLEGCDPTRILCLTFTKAAAAEMANRVRVRLGEWTILPEPELRQSLENLQGISPSDEKLTRARTLFGLTLDTPGGLKIQTIHSFCQSLLKRFPLEAGLSPFFEVMNDTQRQTLLKTASHRVMEDPRHHELILRFSEHTLEELNGFVLQSRDRFSQHGRHSHEGGNLGTLDMNSTWVPAFAGMTPVGNVENNLLHALITPIPVEQLKPNLFIFEEGSPTDQIRGHTLAHFLSLPEEEKIQRYEDYLSLFLTQKGEKRACLLTQKAALKAPLFKDLLEEEGARLEQWLIARHTLEISTVSEAFLNYGQAFLETYEALKKKQSLLDYEDLILKSAALLKNPGCHWVLYKLDGGLDHILVDEAQDTSPTQWQVIRAIAEEFYANFVDETRKRTLFIVGDGKQSIYSFQGADPAVFAQMQQDLSTFARNSGQTWKDIDLTVSFRSTPQVLAVVDAVFSGCPLLSHPLYHLPFRKESAGHVEVWPLIEKEKEESLESWSPPLTQRHPDSPQRRLAKVIAKTIQGWLTGSGPLVRLTSPGDILILVRRRTAFVDTLIRVLKEHEVPVAGIDRLWLLDSLAVQDLLKIGEFLLLPEDDLTLATVLKGPLCNLSDEDLFKLVSIQKRSQIKSGMTAKSVETPRQPPVDLNAFLLRNTQNPDAVIPDSIRDLNLYGRSPYAPPKDTLWKRLQNDESYADVKSLLSDLLTKVDFLTPFSLFSYILGPLGGKKKWQTRLGPECLDSLDEFLNLCVNFQEDKTPSLQGFLYWISQEVIELKRDLDQSHQVRIMTVHGSKGLQAPIVFLPDTTQIPSELPPFEFHEGSLVWLPPAAKDIPLTKELKQKLREKQQGEHNRLLYVALTRAEDALYVCGWEGSAEDSWYDLVTRGMEKVGEEVDFPADGDLSGTGWRLSAGHKSEAPFLSPEKPDAFLMPTWLNNPPLPEISPQLLRPSEEKDDGTFRSSDFGAFAAPRGVLIHKLLETLALVSKDKRKIIASRYLEREQIPPDIALGMIKSVTRVFDAYPDFFGPRSQGEVPIVGAVGDFVLSGQIDRLVMADDHILCIDFKTHTHVPEGLHDIPETYVRQMALYQVALSQVYPQHPIICGLLWTHLPRLDLLPDDLLKKVTPLIDEKASKLYTVENQV